MPVSLSSKGADRDDTPAFEGGGQNRLPPSGIDKCHFLVSVVPVTPIIPAPIDFDPVVRIDGDVTIIAAVLLAD